MITFRKGARVAATTKSTKRPLNKCKKCGRTWYPRGSNLSSRCPQCGSSKTTVAGLGIFGTIGGIALVVMFSGHPDKPESTSSPAFDPSPVSAVAVTKPATAASSLNGSAMDASANSPRSIPTERQDSVNDVMASTPGEDGGANDSSSTPPGSEKEPQNALPPRTEEDSDVFKHH